MLLQMLFPWWFIGSRVLCLVRSYWTNKNNKSTRPSWMGFHISTKKRIGPGPFLGVRVRPAIVEDVPSG
jgi:hypothetical protein